MKKISHWLKGAIIGLIFGFLNVLIFIIGPLYDIEILTNKSSIFFRLYSYIASFPFTYIVPYIGNALDKADIIGGGAAVGVIILGGIITIPLNFALYGALMGWIYGKIRNK